MDTATGDCIEQTSGEKNHGEQRPVSQSVFGSEGQGRHDRRCTPHFAADGDDILAFLVA
jgi:hypothetical protein